MTKMNSENKVPEDCLALVTKILWGFGRRKMHAYMMLQKLLKERLTFPIGSLSSEMMNIFFSCTVSF